MVDYSAGPGRARWQRWLPGGLLVALLLLGASLYRGYGLTLDEPNNHANGAFNLRFAAEFLLPPAVVQRLGPADMQPTPPAGWGGFDHGVAFELPAALLGRLLYPGNAAEYYRLRHLLVFLTFVGCVVLVYRLARVRYPGARWLPLLAAGALVASPRFFAEAFYNGKDIVFMASFALGMFTLVRLVQRPTWQRALLHAATTALAADVRLTGLALLGAFTALALLPAGVPGAVPASARRRLALLALYGGAAGVLTVVGWPYLWADPIERLQYVVGRTGHYPWGGQVLYAGHLLTARQLPWHYLPVWMLITTPLPYSALSLLGLGTAARTLVGYGRAALRRPGAWLDALLLAWLVVPIGGVIVGRAVVYDGWRHLYFVYPALLLLGLRGARALGQAWRPRPAWARPGRARVAGVAVVLLVLETGRTGWFMVRAYPNQQLYFSCLTAPAAERLFERDYWGGSVYYGLSWLLRHDAAPVITVSGAFVDPVYVNWLLLPPAQRRRIQVLADWRQARYFCATYRWHPQAYADSVGPEVLAYRPGGRVKALSIFRLADTLAAPLSPAAAAFRRRPYPSP